MFSRVLMLVSMFAAVLADTDNGVAEGGVENGNEGTGGGGGEGGSSGGGNGTALIIGCIFAGIIVTAIVIAVIYNFLRKSSNHVVGDIESQNHKEIRSDADYGRVMNEMPAAVGK